MSYADALWESFLENESDRLPLLALADLHEERGEVNSAYWVRWLARSDRLPCGDLWQHDRWLPIETIREFRDAIPAALFDALPGGESAGLLGYSERSEIAPRWHNDHGQVNSARYLDRRAAWNALRVAMAKCPPPVAADNRAAVAQS